jgi:hypothetical protein
MKRSLKVTLEELEEAALKCGLTADTAQAIWQELQHQPESEPRFEAAHVGYYFGALLVIGAMGWFMTSGWDTFSGWEIFTIAAGYAVVFLVAARVLWPNPMFRLPAGLLSTVAVCMVPLAVYGLERQFGLWPSTDPGSYTRFHPYINASWMVMEVATVLASIVALRFFPFPFLTAPAAYALWYMSMDVSALVFHKAWTWQQMCRISVIFGLVMLLVSYWLDRKTKLDYSFWGYLFGLLTFTGGLSMLDSGSELARFGYCLIHLAMIAVALLLQRKVFLVFGAVGVFSYLCREAYGYFRNSIAFPFVLSLIGIAIIVAAMAYRRNEAALQQWANSLLSRPPSSKQPA